MRSHRTPSNSHIVYEHVDPRTGECLFAGVCRHKQNARRRSWRLLNGGHAYRLWQLEKDGYGPDDWVRYVEVGVSEERARELLQNILRTRRPLFRSVSVIIPRARGGKRKASFA